MERILNTNKIVFINQSSSHLTKDIVNAFADRFENIILVTGTISDSGSVLNNRIKVVSIVKYNRKTILKRFITWMIATVELFFLTNFIFRKDHIIFTSNPPSVPFIPLLPSIKYSIQILDIYPDALVSGGFISKKSIINKLWIRRNKKYFRDAKNVFTITKGMAKTLSQYCDLDRIKVIEQWPSMTGEFKINKNENRFITENSLTDKFIVMYSGNIGLGHHVDILVKVAILLRDYEDLKFVIIGEGWNKPLIEKLIKENKLTNCLTLPYQTANMFQHSIQAADIGVVSVSKELATLCVPIKTYNLIINEIPLLCVTEGDSELEALISRFNIGRCFTPDALEKIKEYILTLKNEREMILTYKNNLRACAGNFTKKNAFLYTENFNL